MADANSQNYRTVTPSCDHKALKECLDRNNGDRSKCKKEWEAFQRSCTENKRKLQGKQETGSCGCD